MQDSPLLLNLVRLIYVLMGAWTVLQWRRDPRPARRDVVLMFATLVIPSVTGSLQELEIGGAWVTVLGSCALMLHPLATLRLVWRVRPRIAWLDRGATVASLAALGPVAGYGVDLPPAVGTVLLALWVAIEITAVALLLQAASRGTGSHRLRVGLAAAGPGSLAALFGLILVAQQLDAESLVTPVTTLLTAVSAVAFGVGFVPPKWLVRSAQLHELYAFLAVEGSRVTRAGPAAARMLGGAGGVVLPPGDPRLDDARVKAALGGAPLDPSVVGLHGWTALAARMDSTDVHGAIVVALPVEPLFAASDRVMLRLVADAAAEELDIERRIAEKESMVRSLEQTNAELERFAYVASHDLQEPLRMVSSFVELLGKRYKGQLDDEADRYIAFASRGAQRMRRMIDDLLKFSRSSRSEPQRLPVALGGVVDEVLEQLAGMEGMAEAQITVQPLPTVLADRGAMVQVLQNLISNAIKYSPPPAHIAVGGQERDDGWELWVQDDGEGIPEADQDRVFNLFERLHSESSVPGTGLGLALVQRIVQRHGGTVTVVSSPGQGARFSVFLPDVSQAPTQATA